MCVIPVWIQRLIRGFLSLSRENHQAILIMQYDHQVVYPYNTSYDAPYDTLDHASSGHTFYRTLITPTN